MGGATDDVGRNPKGPWARKRRHRVRRVVMTRVVALMAMGTVVCAQPVGGPASGGQRYALIVGINAYINFSDKMQLNGCENDARYIKQELTSRYGFPDSNVRVLLSRQATCRGIQQGLDWLESSSRDGDVCVFYYSGHGTQVADQNGDEQGEDGLDEVLCPTDFKFTSRTAGENYISDDELNARARRLDGRQFVVVLDCCHSGTGLRSLIRPSGGKYLYYEGRAEGAPATGGARSMDGGGPLGGFFETALGTGDAGGRTRALGRGNEESRGFEGLRAVSRQGSGARGAALIAAARSDELAAESEPVVVDGQERVHGCLTLKLVPALRGEADANRDRTITFAELHDYMGTQPLVTARGVQHPQIEVDEAIKNRGVFDTRQIVVEAPGSGWVAGPPVADGATQPPPPYGTPPPPPYDDDTGTTPGIQPLRVALALTTDFTPATPGFDGQAAAALRNEIHRSLAGEPQLFQIVTAQTPYEALVACGAQAGAGGREFEIGIVDGAAQLQRRERGPNPSVLADIARQELRRIYTVRNLLRIRQPPASPYRIGLQLAQGQSRLRTGDKVVFVCRPNREGYLTMLNVNPAGQTALLYPNRWSGGERGWRVDGGQTIQIPSSAMGFEIEVEPPVGSEFVVAFLTPAPMNLSELGLNPNGGPDGGFSTSRDADSVARSVIGGLTRSLDGGLTRSLDAAREERALKTRQKIAVEGGAVGGGSEGGGGGLVDGSYSTSAASDWAVATLSFTTVNN